MKITKDLVKIKNENCRPGFTELLKRDNQKRNTSHTPSTGLSNTEMKSGRVNLNY